MNSSQLKDILQCEERTISTFQGIYPMDMLSQVTVYPLGIIINTSESHVYDGHWVLLYMNNTKEVVFFDSYGRAPANVNNGHIRHEYLSKYTLIVIILSYNVYCLYVAFYLSGGISFNNMFRRFYKDVDCMIQR
jgi:hypothetical protein